MYYTITGIIVALLLVAIVRELRLQARIDGQYRRRAGQARWLRAYRLEESRARAALYSRMSAVRELNAQVDAVPGRLDDVITKNALPALRLAPVPFFISLALLLALAAHARAQEPYDGTPSAIQEIPAPACTCAPPPVCPPGQALQTDGHEPYPCSCSIYSCYTPEPVTSAEHAVADTSMATISILAGGAVAMGATDPGIVPYARVAVALPLAAADRAPDLLVQLDLTGSQGQTVSLDDPATFKSLEFTIGLAQRIGQRLNFGLYAEAGFATRLPGSEEPRDRALRWAGIGVRAGGIAAPGYLAITLNADQRLDGLYRPAVSVAGSVRLWEAESGAIKGATVRLVGQAVLGLDLRRAAAGTNAPLPADSVRVGLAIGK